MQQIQVELGNRSYAIHIGPNLLRHAELLTPWVRDRDVLLVTNDTVAPLYLEACRTSVSASAKRVASLVLPDGERFKTFDYLNRIFDALLEGNFARDSVLLALGGGVIGDMTGFAAACYQRGIDFIQVPTTLLSQVDSSVGGKTAVNHPLGKNMIGAFHQPRLVIIDSDCLKTLPAREFAAGMAEVIKYGVIWDAHFFGWLERHIQPLKAQRQDVITEAISRSCQIKADIVSQDETEQGVRALLNLGHTFGHAIEAEMGYGNWLHGEAVAAGMVLAAETSVQQGLIDVSVLSRLRALLQAFDLPIKAPASMGFDGFIRHMRRDKKVLGGQLRLILPLNIGRAGIMQVPEADLAGVIGQR